MIYVKLAGQRWREPFATEPSDFKDREAAGRLRTDTISGLDLRARLNRPIVQFNEAASTRRLGRRARFVEPRRPQPDINAHRAGRGLAFSLRLHT